MSEPIIVMADVEKTYPYFQLSGVHLRLEPGQIMGFVGPNGAGKSTTIRILMGMVRPDRGDVRVLGHAIPRDEAAAKRDIGFVSDDMRLYGSETLAWHIRLVAPLYPGWDAAYADTLFHRFGLRRDQPIKAMSHGERTKASLLLALARRPRLLLLDEPTTGLDPVARHEILVELMEVVRDEHRAILFSSHNTQDVEQISDAITFLDRGRIIESSDKETFIDRWRRIHLQVPPHVVLPTVDGVIDTHGDGRIIVLTTQAYAPGLLEAYTQAGATVHDVQRMTLEEIFVATVMHSRQERAA
jgi:ABC-2 type transport system ATP-binding protein